VKSIKKSPEEIKSLGRVFAKLVKISNYLAAIYQKPDPKVMVSVVAMGDMEQLFLFRLVFNDTQ